MKKVTVVKYIFDFSAHWFLAIICFPGLEGPVDNVYIPKPVAAMPANMAGVPSPPQPTEDDGDENMETEDGEVGFNVMSCCLFPWKNCLGSILLVSKIRNLFFKIWKITNAHPLYVSLHCSFVFALFICMGLFYTTIYILHIFWFSYFNFNLMFLLTESIVKYVC